MTRSQRIHKFVEESGDHIASSIHATAARIGAIGEVLDDETLDDLADELGPTMVDLDSFDRIRKF
jgi:hypothetical protein